MRYETCCYHFGNSARSCGRRRLFWAANFFRSPQNRKQPNDGCRDRNAGAGAAKTSAQTISPTRTGCPTTITAAASRCDRTAATTNGDAGARTRAGAASTEGEAEAQTKTEAQSGENGQAEETGKGRAGCAQAEAQTAAARRVSEIAQGFDQTQNAGSQGYQKDAKDRQAAAEAEAEAEAESPFNLLTRAVRSKTNCPRKYGNRLFPVGISLAAPRMRRKSKSGFASVSTAMGLYMAIRGLSIQIGFAAINRSGSWQKVLFAHF